MFVKSRVSIQLNVNNMILHQKIRYFNFFRLYMLRFIGKSCDIMRILVQFRRIPIGDIRAQYLQMPIGYVV